jgi:hypothetical protein
MGRNFGMEHVTMLNAIVSTSFWKATVMMKGSIVLPWRQVREYPFRLLEPGHLDDWGSCTIEH